MSGKEDSPKFKGHGRRPRWEQRGCIGWDADSLGVLMEGAMTGLAWEVDKQPLTRAVPASLCHILGTLPSICCDGSLGVRLPSQFKTSDYLLYDPEKLWKDLEGKEKVRSC